MRGLLISRRGPRQAGQPARLLGPRGAGTQWACGSGRESGASLERGAGAVCLPSMVKGGWNLSERSVRCRGEHFVLLRFVMTTGTRGVGTSFSLGGEGKPRLRGGKPPA